MWYTIARNPKGSVQERERGMLYTTRKVHQKRRSPRVLRFQSRIVNVVFHLGYSQIRTDHNSRPGVLMLDGSKG